MKRILYYMLTCCAALLFFACTADENFPEKTGEDGIILDLSMGSQAVSRAAAEGPEVAVDHLDVMIFSSTDESLVWHERISNCQERQGKVTLAADRKSFGANATYWVYLVANSKHTADEFASIADLNGLKSMTQEDRLIHMTGLTNVTGAPQTFLMDGIAYPGALTQEPEASTPVVLNKGKSSDNTELKVVLRRAAAKIMVTINKGDKVTFDKGVAPTVPGYYLRNMPYTTSVLAGIDGDADLRTPPFSNAGYFNWTESTITVTAYVYAHSWADASALEREVRLVVNIPMSYQEEDATDPVVLPNNYYQIPVSKEKKLERNTYYAVTVTVNAPGATDPSTPQELTDVNYEVRPWDETTVNIGGEDGRPIYLTVNEEEMEMHNITDDNTTLHFASSSDVSAIVTRVYYYDKFGQEQDERTSIVTATPDAGLNGGIDIHCPLPTNNTIRYIEMTVRNADGVERQVLIRQYPLEYITNILGWYSYRSDFGGTTYELLNGQDVSGMTFDNSNRIESWICGCEWSNNRWSYGKTETGFFGSKVAGEVETSGQNAGKAHIYYYRWNEKSSGWINPRPPYTYSVSQGSDVWGGYANPRMYHVQITASSGDYTLGRPRITNGITDSHADNAQLVSPSFMIASQLGAVMSANNVNIAASHCEQYVEVYKDKQTGQTVHLDDWRLPTKAELEIIMKFQYVQNAAMDEVLAGPSYWSASGLVYNNRGSGTAMAIRCIRDAYEEK